MTEEPTILGLGSMPPDRKAHALLTSLLIRKPHFPEFRLHDVKANMHRRPAKATQVRFPFHVTTPLVSSPPSESDSAKVKPGMGCNFRVTLSRRSNST